MDFSPTPIEVADRAWRLLGRAGARAWPVLLFIGFMPERVISDTVGGDFDAGGWAAAVNLAVWLVSRVFLGLAYVIAQRMMADEIDGPPRANWTAGAVLRQVRQGAWLFALTGWLVVPLMALKTWLFQVNPLACAALWYTTAYFMPAFVIDRRPLRVCARNALRLARSRSPGIVVAVVLTLVLQWGLSVLQNLGFGLVALAGAGEKVTFTLDCLIRSALAVVVAAWTMGLYACLRERVEGGAQRVADLFD